MARFYFHLRIGNELVPDDEGSELPGLDAAKHAATQSARELLGNAIRSEREDSPDAVVVADGEGRELASVALADMIPKKYRT
jgi:hypothetical protein